MVTDLNEPGSAAPPIWQRCLVGFLGCVAMVWLALLAVETALRVRFPWDLYLWPESPFMTNMLKLHLGQPIFGPAADGNSFVYSPGLEYLTFALLKPLGLDLDIRWCRVVTVGVGLLAGLVAALALRRVLACVTPENRFPRLGWLGGMLAVLVIFKNFTADVPHPDNLVMLHGMLLFWLAFWAWREKNFGVAILVMAIAGCGALAKQTLALSFVGPALVFARFNPWGWRKWLALVAVGVASTTVALLVLWSSPDARFYTLRLLPGQGIHFTRFYWMMIDLVTGDRAFLLMLGLLALPLVWRAGSAGRQYLQFWVAIGLFSVCPNAMAYVKTMGTWNNLVIFQLWLLLLVWPAVAAWLVQTSSPKTSGQRESPLFGYAFATPLIIFLFLLLPPKEPALAVMYSACNEVQSQVTADIKAGRKIMVGHGMMYLLRAGSMEVPLDRVNSILELKAGGLQDLCKFPERLRQHYYDRLYLTVEDWYPPEFNADIEKYYRVQSVVRQPQCSNHAETGRYLALIGDCRIMVPREPTP